MKKLTQFSLASLLLSGCLMAGQVFAEVKSPATEIAPQTEMAAQQNVAAEQQNQEGKLNINTATASEIQKALIGIGAKKAEAIVQYRQAHGNFTVIEQLLEVQGIGKVTLEKNRDRIALE